MFRCFIKLFPPLYENFPLVLCISNDGSSFTKSTIEKATPTRDKVFQMSFFQLNQIWGIRLQKTVIFGSVFVFVTLCICDVLRDLVPFAQFKNREKDPWRSATFNKVAGF